MRPALAQVCSLPSTFAQDIEDYAAGKCNAIEVWLTKLEDYLRQHSVADLRELLAHNEMELVAASYQGGLFNPQPEARDVQWQLFAQRLARCQELAIPVLVLAADVAGALTQSDLDRIVATLGEAAALASQHHVRLALEFQARSPFLNNLQTAAAVVHEIQSPALGICLDSFHYWNGPSKTEDLGYLTAENLFHVQLSDQMGTPREFATDSDRILPGDGECQLAPLLARLREIDYRGAISVELLNPQLWQVPPRQLGEIALTALHKFLGINSGG